MDVTLIHTVQKCQLFALKNKKLTYRKDHYLAEPVFERSQLFTHKPKTRGLRLAGRLLWTSAHTGP